MSSARHPPAELKSSTPRLRADIYGAMAGLRASRAHPWVGPWNKEEALSRKEVLLARGQALSMSPWLEAASLPPSNATGSRQEASA